MGRFNAEQKIIMLLVFFITYINTLRPDNIKIVGKSAMMTLSLTIDLSMTLLPLGYIWESVLEKEIERERERDFNFEHFSIITHVLILLLPALIIVGGNIVW